MKEIDSRSKTYRSIDETITANEILALGDKGVYRVLRTTQRGVYTLEYDDTKAGITRSNRNVQTSASKYRTEAEENSISDSYGSFSGGAISDILPDDDI